MNVCCISLFFYLLLGILLNDRFSCSSDAYSRFQVNLYLTEITSSLDKNKIQWLPYIDFENKSNTHGFHILLQINLHIHLLAKYIFMVFIYNAVSPMAPYTLVNLTFWSLVAWWTDTLNTSIIPNSTWFRMHTIVMTHI